MTTSRAAIGFVGLCSLLLAAAPVAAASYECLIEPRIEISVSSAVAGVVDSVAVQRGDRVKRGQVLVRLKSGVERAAYELAQARAEFAGRKFRRNQDLVEEQLISTNDRDEFETEEKLAQLEMREAEEFLKLRTIRSPIDGVVADVSAAPGEHVRENEMMRLAQIHPLNVEVIVPVADFGLFQTGMSASVLPEAPFDAERQATVVIVDRVVDAASGTIGVRLELPNDDHALPAGLKCTVELSPPDAPAQAQ